MCTTCEYALKVTEAQVMILLYDSRPLFMFEDKIKYEKKTCSILYSHDCHYAVTVTIVYYG